MDKKVKIITILSIIGMLLVGFGIKGYRSMESDREVKIEEVTANLAKYEAAPFTLIPALEGEIPEDDLSELKELQRLFNYASTPKEIVELSNDMYRKLYTYNDKELNEVLDKYYEESQTARKEFNRKVKDLKLKTELVAE